MSRHRPSDVKILAPTGTPERELLAKFRGPNGGFQVPSQGSYRQHKLWRKDVLRGLKLLEAEGLLVVQQLVPCERHERCGGQPVAAGCQLTAEGQRVRGFLISLGSAGFSASTSVSASPRPAVPSESRPDCKW
jgi:hypothetical protein